MSAPVSILPLPFDAEGLAVDEQLARIQRLGRKLFRSASCMITFGNGEHQPTLDLRSTASIELLFCYEMQARPEMRAVLDARLDPELHLHRFVKGPPYIRFFVTCPVRDAKGEVIGSISVLDYAPHTFGDDDRGTLADLASLVERELHFRSVSESQSELMRKNKNLRRKSLLDSLIGTWNRGAITRILSIEATRCAKMGAPLSLVLLDLDHFKSINDTYGHPVGDKVLIAVAGRLRACIRPQEALGRYGGEEFLVILPGAGVATALTVAERMREAVAARPEKVGEIELNLSISAGMASTEILPNTSNEEMIKLADEALYRAKATGRNRVCSAKADTQ